MIQREEDWEKERQQCQQWLHAILKQQLTRCDSFAVLAFFCVRWFTHLNIKIYTTFRTSNDEDDFNQTHTVRGKGAAELGCGIPAGQKSSVFRMRQHRSRYKMC